MLRTTFLWAHAGLLEAMNPYVPKALQDSALPRSTMHPALSQETTPTTLRLLHPRPLPLPHLVPAPLLLLLGRVLLAKALAVVQDLPTVAAMVAVRPAQTLEMAVEGPAAAQLQQHLAVSLLLLVCLVPMIAPEVNNSAFKP